MSLNEALEEVVRKVVREELAANLKGLKPEPDRLLRAKEAAAILGVSPRHLYRHAKELPFSMWPISNGGEATSVRFSFLGLQKYLERKRKIQEARSGSS